MVEGEKKEGLPVPEVSGQPKGKRISESQTTFGRSMQPEDANTMGNVHGGVIMKLVDEAGGITAARHARHPSVTVAVDSLRFMEPVHVGDFVIFDAKLTYVGRTSMEAEVNVIAENLTTGERRHTNSANLVYVALGDDKRPIEVPPLILETDEEKELFAKAQKRQNDRLANRQNTTNPS